MNKMVVGALTVKYSPVYNEVMFEALLERR
jgi:hypothetical protein